MGLFFYYGNLVNLFIGNGFRLQHPRLVIFSIYFVLISFCCLTNQYFYICVTFQFVPTVTLLSFAT